MKAAPTDRQAVHASQEGGAQQRFAHLHPDDRVGELLSHPAFQGFSRLMLPWDGRAIQFWEKEIKKAP